MRYLVTRRILTGPSAGLEVETKTDVEFEAGREYGDGSTGSRYLIVEVRERTLEELVAAGLDPEVAALVAESREKIRETYARWLETLPGPVHDWTIARDEVAAEARRRAAVSDWHLEDWRLEQEDAAR
jgi:hypothetical protein